MTTRSQLIDELCRNHGWSAETFDVWERSDFRCAYCGMDHLARLEAFKLGQTDHLLPQSNPKYAVLANHPSNHVLSCQFCNFVKRAIDFNEIDGDTNVWAGETSIADEQRKRLIARAKKYIMHYRIERERSFLTEKELILSWMIESRS